MSDFVILKKEESTSEAKAVSFVKLTSKELSFVLKVILFVTVFSGLIFMPMSSDNLMLEELLVSGGISSLVFLIHILSNR